MAEHFRDAEGQDVLLFIDNIFRFTQVSLRCHFAVCVLCWFSHCWSSAALPSCTLLHVQRRVCFRLSCTLFQPWWPVPRILKHACVQANSEVSALLGRIPSAVGYQPTLATDLGTLQERITTTKKGSITSVQVLVNLPARTGFISMY